METNETDMRGRGERERNCSANGERGKGWAGDKEKGDTIFRSTGAVHPVASCQWREMNYARLSLRPQNNCSLSLCECQTFSLLLTHTLLFALSAKRKSIDQSLPQSQTHRDLPLIFQVSNTENDDLRRSIILKANSICSSNMASSAVALILFACLASLVDKTHELDIGEREQDHLTEDIMSSPLQNTVRVLAVHSHSPFSFVARKEVGQAPSSLLAP